jgi:ArsR family transcriptional regulator, virulence genes transcriptional regulator
MSERAGKRPDPETVDALSDKVSEVCATLRAMANETRLRILCVLFEGEMPVNQIAEAVGQSLSAVSQHLSKLKAEGLVTSRRDGQTIYYRSTGGVGTAVIRTLCSFYER